MKPLVRILGVDGSGKTTICEQLEKLDSQVITFGSTPRYAYRWLETYGIGKADEVTPEQVEVRQKVFSRMNEQEAYLHDDLRKERPVVAVRGRADTWISANALRSKPMPKDMGVLFPKELRPDLLVVLNAPLKTIEARIDARLESKTGANSMDYHKRTSDMYDELASIAKKHMPVLQYSSKGLAPDVIAADILATMYELDKGKKLAKPSFKLAADQARINEQVVEHLSFDVLSDSLQADIKQARYIALQQAFPRNKVTKAGCVLVANGKKYTGANIKRWSWNNTTCAERMAIDQALVAGVTSIDRVIVYVTGEGQAITGTVSPCGPCRELLKEALHNMRQEDVDVYMVGPDGYAKVLKSSLLRLLPLSDGLKVSEPWH